MENVLNKNLLTQKEVAEYLRVSVGTVINQRKKGFLPNFRFPGSKRFMYPVEGIKEAVKQYTTPAKEVMVNPKNETAARKRKKPVISTGKQKNGGYNMAKKRKKDFQYMRLRGKKGMYYFQGMIKRKRYNEPLSTDEDEAICLRDQYLYEINKFGAIQRDETKVSQTNDGMPFGEVAQRWVKTAEKKIKSSTLKDYRGAMNFYILSRFGNVPIQNIGFLDVEEFISELACSHKRINNILVSVAGCFQLRFEG